MLSVHPRVSTESESADCVCHHSRAAHRGPNGECDFCSCRGFQEPGESSDELAAALALLSRNPAFSNVPAENLLALGSFGRRRLVMEGEILIAPDDPSEHLYLLLRGRVRVDRPPRGSMPRLDAQL